MNKEWLLEHAVGMLNANSKKPYKWQMQNRRNWRFKITSKTCRSVYDAKLNIANYQIKMSIWKIISAEKMTAQTFFFIENETNEWKKERLRCLCTRMNAHV